MAFQVNMFGTVRCETSLIFLRSLQDKGQNTVGIHGNKSQVSHWYTPCHELIIPVTALISVTNSHQHISTNITG